MRSLDLYLETYGIFFSVWVILHFRYIGIDRSRASRSLIQMMVLVILVSASDMAAIVARGNPTIFGWWAVRISNFLVFAGQDLMIVCMARYVYFLVQRKRSYVHTGWLYSIYGIMGICVLLLILNPFLKILYVFDEQNRYHRQPLFPVVMALSFAAIVIIVCFIWRSRRTLSVRQRASLYSFLIFPSIAVVLQTVFYGHSLINEALAVSALVIYCVFIFEYRNDVNHQKNLMIQSRAYLLNSQIKPHFMFNSLTAIRYLILKDPDHAVEAIEHLADYLHKELDLKAVESMIPIKEELEYVGNYLYMEQLRFGDRLKVEYEVSETVNFKLPFLTIQPLVENAVRHGVRKKIEGGTVKIRTGEDEEKYFVDVIDDGAGVELKNGRPVRNPDPAHNEGHGIGLENVDERIRMLCGGTMEFESIVGEGTRVRICIPKAKTDGREEEGERSDDAIFIGG